MREPRNNHTIVSHQTLRKYIGFLGLILPIILIGAGWLTTKTFPSSLSMFYYTDLRDIFVGLFCAMGIMLLIYRGFTRQKGEWLTDRFLSSLAALSVFGMVFLPIPFIAPDFGTCLGGTLQSITVCGHYGFLGLFFLTMATFSLILFRRVNKAQSVNRRRQGRNRLYFRSGLLTLLSFALIATYLGLPAKFTAIAMPYNPVLWLQALALAAIGLSWLVKGGGLSWMNDRAIVEKPKSDDDVQAKAKRRKIRQAAKAAEVDEKPAREVITAEAVEQAA